MFFSAVFCNHSHSHSPFHLLFHFFFTMLEVIVKKTSFDQLRGCEAKVLNVF